MLVCARAVDGGVYRGWAREYRYMDDAGKCTYVGSNLVRTRYQTGDMYRASEGSKLSRVGETSMATRARKMEGRIRSTNL